MILSASSMRAMHSGSNFATRHILFPHGLRSWLSSSTRAVSRPTRETGLRWIAAAQQLLQLSAVPRRKLDLKPYASAPHTAIQPDLARAEHLQWLPIHDMYMRHSIGYVVFCGAFSPRIATLARNSGVQSIKGAE
jgi:hypothetical protein